MCAKGFEAFIYESPIERTKRLIEAGEKPGLNLYFVGKNAISDFVKDMDLVLTLCDVTSGRPAFGMSKGGGEIPWYVFEVVEADKFVFIKYTEEIFQCSSLCSGTSITHDNKVWIIIMGYNYSSVFTKFIFPAVLHSMKLFSERWSYNRH